MSHILIVEDEPRIIEFLERGLSAHGYTTTVARTGPAALSAAVDGGIDLIILDLGLPGLDGLEVLRELRGRGSTTPVLVLTARGGVDNTILGLDAGADDYLSKPFRFDELLARVRARLRTDSAAAAGTADDLAVGGIALNVRTRRATVAGRQVDLSAREFMMLEAFLRSPGEVLSREQLLSRVWGYDHNPGSNVVEVYVGYLRRKLGAELIATVRGMGYRFDAT
jgi:DNA-binding response OmpR family regulator